MSRTSTDPNSHDLEVLAPDLEVTDVDVTTVSTQARLPGPRLGAAPAASEALDAGAQTDQPVQPAQQPDLTQGQAPARARRVTRHRVSGLYRGTSQGTQLDLRVDVDGRRPTRRLSGDYLTTTGGTTSWTGSFVVTAPRVRVSATTVRIEGTARTTWSTTYDRLRVSIPRVPRTERSPAPATVEWFDAAGTPGASYTCDLQGRAFRTVLWEQDSVAGTIPFVDYDTASLPRPPGTTARRLDVVRAFADAGIQVISSGVPNVIAASLSGADSRWSESELHQAMQASFSLWADVEQWHVYSLVATRFTQDGVRGIMYDASDNRQRQGMAVFHDAVHGTDAATQRAALRTYVHELGHCFNLLHSWQKDLATPPQPLGPNGGLGDLSWMNYAWKFQPPPPAPGGEAAYWSAFDFQFTTAELAHLRHALRPDIIMGGSAFGTGSGDIDPLAFDTLETDRSGLRLELRAKPTFGLGEPVVVELKLSTTTRDPVRTHGRLHPRDGLTQLAVQDPSGRVRSYRPLMPRCVDHTAATTVLDESQPAIYESAYVGYGAGGAVFEQVGTYRLRAVYVADDGSRVVSPTLALRVRAPLSAADDEVADLMLADGQGDLLYLLGSDAPSLTGARDAMETVLERHPDHPMAVYAQLTKGINDERTYKALQPDKELRVREPRTADAVDALESVVEASTGDGGVDNITLNMVIRRQARAQAKAGDVEEAMATLDRLPATFDAKGVKPAVLQTIEAQAEQEKRVLRVEVLGEEVEDAPQGVAGRS